MGTYVYLSYDKLQVLSPACIENTRISHTPVRIVSKKNIQIIYLYVRMYKKLEISFDQYSPIEAEEASQSG